MIRCPFENDELVLEPICEEVVSAPQRDDWFAGEEVEAEEIDVDRSSDRRFGREREVEHDERGGVDQRAMTRTTADTRVPGSQRAGAREDVVTGIF